MSHIHNPVAQNPHHPNLPKTRARDVENDNDTHTHTDKKIKKFAMILHFHLFAFLVFAERNHFEFKYQSGCSTPNAFGSVHFLFVAGDGALLVFIPSFCSNCQLRDKLLRLGAVRQTHFELFALLDAQLGSHDLAGLRPSKQGHFVVFGQVLRCLRFRLGDGVD